MKRFGWSIGLLISLSLPFYAQATLKEGDKAPPLKVAKWIKGKPIQRFEPGKVYVVEFWATWCGPCRQSIPHLTELAQKFRGKVTIVGVSIWENPRNNTSSDYMPRVEQFVREMGDKMNYIVAVDDPKGTVARAWMNAAGQDGIPTAFVVDQRGRIVWIGHPMGELEEVLEQVLAGKFNWQKHAQERQARARDEAAVMQLFERLSQLRQQKKYQDALRELEQAEKRYPAYKETFVLTRYDLLLYVDEQKAYALARQLANGMYKNNPGALNMLAWSIVEDSTERSLKLPDYALAVEMAQRAVQLTQEKDPYILDTLAYALFKQGKVEEAIRYQEKAVALLKEQRGVPDDIKREIEGRLEKFRKARP
ncbi:MAG: redoxin family protein [Fimbriimonadales bacterium]|nr:redoxin family protein [Fimbriimonadales bacterium]